MEATDKAKLEQIQEEIISIYPTATEIHIDISPGLMQISAQYPNTVIKRKKQEENIHE